MESLAEVLAVGNELLLGDTINSNAATIARGLAGIGVHCSRHVVVGDSQAEIVQALNDARARASIVIVCGGLGPTEDDLTREAVASALGRTLVRDDAFVDSLRERFKGFGRTMPERNAVQGDIVAGARIIETTWGTAPGQIIETAEAVVYLLPGVPAELADMLERAVLPDVADRVATGKIVSHLINVVGLPESGIAEMLRPLWESIPAEITLAYLPAAGEVRVKLTASARDEAAARAIIEPVAAKIRDILGNWVIGTDQDDLNRTLVVLLAERGWTLGGAESLTGGALGARCTSQEGASAWFRGSIVAYSTDVKRSVLGVAKDLIDRHGVVSPEVAVAMAQGARSALGADVGVSLTGVAGPGPQGQPVGTVCLAVATPAGAEVRTVRLPGGREQIRDFAVTAALSLAARTLRGY